MCLLQERHRTNYGSGAELSIIYEADFQALQTILFPYNIDYSEKDVFYSFEKLKHTLTFSLISRLSHVLIAASTLLSP